MLKLNLISNEIAAVVRERRRAKQRENMRRYRARHPEKAQEAYRRWREKYPERAHQKDLECNRRYRARHPDRRAKFTKAWYYKNRAAVAERSRKWRAANKERIKQVNDAWCAANKEAVRLFVLNRRARKRNAAGNATTEQVRARVEFYGSRCYRCGGDFEAIDHVIPLTRGGTNFPANLRPICRSCNSRKHNKLLREMAGQ